MTWLNELALAGQMASIVLAVVGWGALLTLLLGRALHTEAATDGSAVVLYGFYLTLLFGQFAPLFVPVGGIVGIAWRVAGVALLLVRLRPVSGAFGGPIVSNALLVLTVVVALIPAAAIQPRYDAALYHFQFVQWMAEHGTVLGLANLHGRFGFNSAWLSAAALFSFPGGAANGAVTWHVIGVTLPYAALLFRGVIALARRQSLSGAFALISATILVALPLDSNVTGATSTDLPTALMMLHGFTAALAWGERRNGGDYVVLACCVAMAIILKLSSAPIALLLLAGMRDAWHSRSGRRCLLAGSALIAVLGAVWAAQNLALTGCVVYPVLASCPDLPWTVDGRHVDLEARWVTAWARLPSRPLDDPVFENFRWIAPWMTRHRPLLLAFAAILACGAAGFAAARLLRRPSIPASIVGLPFAVSIAGLAFWFVAAPDPRFAIAFIVAIPGLLLAYSVSEYRRTLVVACAMLLLGLGFQQFRIWEPLRGRPDRHNLAAGLQFQAPHLVAHVTRHGATVAVVVDGDRCWLAALPCTPYSNPDLAERAWGPFRMYSVRE